MRAFTRMLSRAASLPRAASRPLRAAAARRPARGLAATAAVSAAAAAAVAAPGQQEPAAEDEEPKPREMPAEYANMKVFSGRANQPLAEDITRLLGVPLGDVDISCFADGEIGISVRENVRGSDVYIIQPTCPPDVNSNLMELLLLVSTMRRASAASITAVIPYYGYARADRKMKSRVPISAADVARLLEAMGVDRVVAIDMHCGQIQGFFSPRTPVDNLEGAIVGLRHFLEKGLEGDKTVVVSPDAGGVGRAKAFRDLLKKNGMDAGLALMVKERPRAGVVSSVRLVGNVDGHDAILIDDMVASAGTLCKAAEELKRQGANRVFAFCTHALLTSPEKVRESSLDALVVTDTLPLNEDQASVVTRLSTAALLANAIDRIQRRESVSDLFK